MRLLLTALLLATAMLSAADDVAPDPAEDLRPLWSPPTRHAFLTRWLVCGPFPNPPRAGETGVDHTVPCPGLDTDYLAAAGTPEADVQPRAGDTVPHADGARRWQPAGGADRLDFGPALNLQQTDLRVAYAWTTFVHPAAGEAVLALGSDDGVKAWLNGRLIHEHIVGRGAQPDQDLVPVTLRAGTNSLLCKVENGTGGWSLYARILPTLVAAAVHDDWKPELQSERGTGDVVRVVAAGPFALQAAVFGRAPTPLATTTTQPGETPTFDPTTWPEGAFEVTLRADAPDGTPRIAHLPGVRGDWRSQAGALLDAAAALPGAARDADALRLRVVADLLRHRLGGDPRTNGVVDAAWRQAHPILMEGQALALPPAARTRSSGFLRLAWVDPVDNSAQFARSYAPHGYHADRAWPLVVDLHGYNPRNPPYVNWWGADRIHDTTADRHGVILLAPHGRGNAGYRGIGEDDVLRAIDEARRVYHVDAERIYLTGYSMGGAGTWQIGSRHTDLFAAIAPVFGGWDYRIWTDAQRFATLDAVGRFRNEAWSSFACAEALRNTPVFVNHGDADDLVDVRHSRHAVRLLQRWGYPLRYWEHPGKGHGGLDERDAVVRWLLDRTLQRTPNEVRIRAPYLRDAKADWVRVTQQAVPYVMIQVHARRAREVLLLETDNVLELALQRAALASVDTVLWNGRAVTPIAVDEATWMLRDASYTPGALHKRPERAGPMHDAERTPFAIVIGTQSADPAMRHHCRTQAEAKRDAWHASQHVPPRVFLDTELSAADLQRYSLLLYGGPEDNLVTRALWDVLPVRVRGNSVQIGDHVFDAADAAVGVTWPHPHHPDRYLVLRMGTSPAGMYRVSMLNDQHDFTIVDGRVDPDDEVGYERLAIAAGCFGPHWNTHPAGVVRGDATARAAALQRPAPRHLTTDVPYAPLYLSDVLADRTSGSFGDLRRDRTWDYRPLRRGWRRARHGLGVSVWHEPNWAEYHIEGRGWVRLRGWADIDVDRDSIDEAGKRGTGITFEVRGDGELLYRSAVLAWDSDAVPIDVDVRDVGVLRLSVHNASTWQNASRSVNWIDLRLER